MKDSSYNLIVQLVGILFFNFIALINRSTPLMLVAAITLLVFVFRKSSTLKEKVFGWINAAVLLGTVAATAIVFFTVWDIAWPELKAGIFRYYPLFDWWGIERWVRRFLFESSLFPSVIYIVPAP